MKFIKYIPLYMFAVLTFMPSDIYAAQNASSAGISARNAQATSASAVTIDELLGLPLKNTVPDKGKTTVRSLSVKGAAMMSSGSSGAGSPFGPEDHSQNVVNTISVDQRSATAGLSIPLDIPNGRSGMTPSLNLLYSPSSGDGVFGWGWSMDIGEVVRSTKDGVPSYGAADVFVSSIAGKKFDLVALGGDEYRPKSDDERMRFFFKNGQWTARDRNGRTYYFGSRSGSQVGEGSKVFKWRLDRIEDLLGNVLVIDYRSDGSFEVRYGLMAGKNIMTDVDKRENFAYVVTANVDAQQRPDSGVSYKPGFMIKKESLITALQVYGGGSLIRKYLFSYRSSASTGRSLLQDVQEVGSDNVSARKVINIRYNDVIEPPLLKTSLTSPGQGDNLWACTIYKLRSPEFPEFIMTSNGVMVRLQIPESSGPFVQASGSVYGLQWNSSSSGGLFVTGPIGTYAVCSTYLYVRSAKTVSAANVSFGVVPWTVSVNGAELPFSSSKSWNLNPGYNFISIKIPTVPTISPKLSFSSDIVSQVDLMNSAQVVYPQWTGDFDGDGRSDVATFFVDTGTVKVALSAGNNFLPKETWIEGFGKGQKILLGDFNFDGRVDVGGWDSAAGTFHVALSDGKKFTDSGIWLRGIPQAADMAVGDMNGDGRPDLYIISHDSSGWSLQVARNKGASFDLSETYRPHIGGADAVVMAADFNGDGLTDVAGFEKTPGNWFVHLNTNGFGDRGCFSVFGFGVNRTPAIVDFNQDGNVDIGYYDSVARHVVYRPAVNNGFGAEKVISVEFFSSGSEYQLQIADFNGDGLHDYMIYNTAGAREIALSSGTLPDLLNSYDNAVGGRVDISYGSSVDSANRYLPFPLAVVSGVSVSNGLGDVYRMTYSYKGGYWDPQEHEFYGFQEANMSDALGSLTTTRFRQDNVYMRGLVERVLLYSKDGTILRDKQYQWNNDALIDGRSDIRFVSLKKVDSFVYNTPMSGLRTAQEFVYDIPLGLPVKVVDHGKVDFFTGDDRDLDGLSVLTSYVSNPDTGLYGLPAVRRVVDANGGQLSKESFYYDNLSDINGRPIKGLLTRQDSWNKSGLSETTVSILKTYNVYGLISSVKDSSGAVTTIAYDPLWMMFPGKLTDAKGMTTVNDYYGVGGVPVAGGQWGALRSVADVNGQRSLTVYDAFGRLASVIGPMDSAAYPTVRYEYQDRTDYRTVITRRCVEHGFPETLDSYAYLDGLGRILSIRSPSETRGRAIVSGQVSYNTMGFPEKEYYSYLSTKGMEVLELPDRSRYGVTHEYDILGREVKTQYPDGSYGSYQYAALSTAMIDPNGHQRILVKDARGRVTRVEEYIGSDGRSNIYPQQDFSVYASTSYEYDSSGNLLRLVDAQGNATRMTYDSHGRKLTISSPDTNGAFYQYDLLGRLKAQTDARNIQFSFEYDQAGRLISKNSPAGLADRVTYSYDAVPNGKGRLSRAVYASGSSSFTYDVLGREVGTSKVIDGKAYVIGRSYDALGRLKELTYPDGKTKALYRYNSAGLLDGVSLAFVMDPRTGAVSTRDIVKNIDYTAEGDVFHIEYGNGMEAFYGYDPRSLRLSYQRVTDPASKVLQEKVYSYDPAGNTTRIEDRLKNNVAEYEYDHLGRMIRSDENGRSVGYVYDRIGNLVKKSDTAYTYGEKGAGPHAVTSLSDGTKMSYDVNGNMIFRQVIGKSIFYIYDSMGRLIRVEARPSGSGVRERIAEYAYDGDGGRSVKTVYYKVKVAHTVPASCKNTIVKGKATKVCAPARVEYADETRSAKTYYVGSFYEESGGVQTRQVLLGGQIVAALEGTQLRWFLSDHLGGINVAVDDRGAVVQRVEYSPWGEIRSVERYGNTAETAWFYFTGKKFDDTTGLYYFGARYYDPQLGRFITPDPLVQDPLNPQALDRYAYVLNNPLSRVDPDGRASFKKFFHQTFDRLIDYYTHPDDFLKEKIIPVVTSAVVTFVCSGASLVAVAAAVTTTVVMNTGEGRQAASRVADQVMDDALGVNDPRTSHIMSSVAIYTALTLGFERLYATATAPSATVRQYDPANPDQQRLIRDGKGHYTFGQGVGFDSSGAPNLPNMQVLYVGDQPVGIVGAGKITDGVFGAGPFKALGLAHTAAKTASFPYADMAVKAPWLQYATIFGTCHQATNATLLASGISNTVVGVTGEWSTALSTMVYGNYGGGLAGKVYVGQTARNGGE